MINISKVAQKHFEKLLLKQKSETHIRIFITNPGTLMAECGISYYDNTEIKQNDVEIKFNNFNVYIDKSDVCYLKDVKIDIKIEGANSHITLIAPFAKRHPNQNELSLHERIQLFFNKNINPYLSQHGGKVNLVEITNIGYIVIQFSGGCNGCSMVGTTIREGIEKKILLAFPEVKGVIDNTVHQSGQHSYY
ncbi:NifU family protein [Buchnera aphidicola]|uniref:NifU family protein n=1 Tax=Buchnera aphidicola TaxID=9 RepID=UPI0031B86C23